MEVLDFLTSLAARVSPQLSAAEYLTKDITDAAVNAVNADFDLDNAPLHPVTLLLSQMEIDRLQSIVSQHNFTESEFIRRALRYFIDSLAIQRRWINQSQPAE